MSWWRNVAKPDWWPVVSWALDFPIIYKILVANTVLVAVGTVIGSLLQNTHRADVPGHAINWEIMAPLGAVFLIVVVINYAIIRAALQPVSSLAHLVTSLRRGDTDARARQPLFGDPSSKLVIQAANDLLEELSAYRRRLTEMLERATMQLETERGNIAREIHDDTAQNLATLLVMEQIIADAQTAQERAQAINQAKQLTRLTLEGVRRLSVGLRPAIFDDMGAPGALRWYVEELLSDVLPEVELRLDESLDRLPPVTELALYRVAQEALSNVARHAQASKVCISINQVAGDVTLQIADDGVGFDEDGLSSNNREHLGLFTIRERARLAGGQADITSQPGDGTTVEVRLPIKTLQSRVQEDG